jgi:transposase
MGTVYDQLSADERYAVARLHDQGRSIRQIAVDLDRSPSTISRELNRNAGQYRHMGEEFAKHEAANHGIGEYVRGDAHSDTVENYFSILKRGITGTYHHVSQQHLKRYLAEFDFRYNERSGLGVNDAERATKALKGIVGKRLTYRRTNQA